MRIDFNPYGRQGGYAQEWLGVRLSKDDRSTDDLPHEFDSSDRDIQFELCAVS